MKTKLFFLLVVGFALSMLSCNSDPAGTPNDEKGVDTYGTTGSTHDPLVHPDYPDGKPDMGEPEEPIAPPHVNYIYLELVITVDEIKSFNVTTREVVFTDLISRKLITLPFDECVYNKLTIYYGNKLLFEKIPKTSGLSSFAINDLALIQSWGESLEESKFHFADGYPEWDIDGEQVMYEGGDSTPVDWKKIRKENAEKRKAEWDIFIKYLTDAGKIVE